jgi:hypothetical protein
MDSKLILYICYYPGALIRWLFLHRKKSLGELVREKSMVNGWVGFGVICLILSIWEITIGIKEGRHIEAIRLTKMNLELISVHCDSLVKLYDSALFEVKQTNSDTTFIKKKYETRAKHHFGKINLTIGAVNTLYHKKRMSEEEFDAFKLEGNEITKDLQARISELRSLGFEFALEEP